MVSRQLLSALPLGSAFSLLGKAPLALSWLSKPYIELFQVIAMLHGPCLGTLAADVRSADAQSYGDDGNQQKRSAKAETNQRG
jgi:hypothetical protein